MVNIAGRRWPFSLLSENREKDPAEIFFFFIPFKKAQQLVARWLFGNGCHAADTTSQWLEAFDWPRDRAVLLRSHLVANLMPLLPRESNASYLAYVCGGEERKRKRKKKKSADWDAVCTILGWKWQSHGLNRERKRGSTKRYNDDDDIEASWWLPPIHHHPLLVGRSIRCDTDCLFPGFSRGREEKTASSDFLLLGLRDCRWVLQNEVTPPRHNKTMTSPRAHRETSIIPRIPLKNSLIERREPRSFLTSPHTHIGPLLCVRVKATTRHFYHPANPLISPFKDRRSDPLSLSQQPPGTTRRPVFSLFNSRPSAPYRNVLPVSMSPWIGQLCACRNNELVDSSVTMKNDRVIGGIIKGGATTQETRTCAARLVNNKKEKVYLTRIPSP